MGAANGCRKGAASGCRKGAASGYRKWVPQVGTARVLQVGAGCRAPQIRTTLKLIRPPKKNVFNIHDPKNMKRLFQLRVGLNPLRHHKKRHNFKDTMSDICRCEMSIETTEHFLVYCEKQHVSSN